MSAEVVNFMTSRAGVLVLGPGHISHTVKINYFFLNLLFYPQAYIRQTEAIVMPFEGTQILNFITPGIEILVFIGRGHTNHISIIHFFL